MKKTSDRVEAARKVAADRVGPLAQSAADRVGPLTVAAAAALGAASQKVSPLATQAAAVVSPYTASALGAVTPLAQQAAEKLTPLADSAKLLGGQAAQGAAERFGPAIEDALDKVGPAVESAVESARDKVSDDLLPKLTGALTAAAGAPIVTEAVSRGQATLAAARGDLTLPPVKKKGSWPKRLGVVAAVAGVAYVLVRKLLGSKDSDWQAARPTTPYAPPTPATNSTGPVSEASIFAADEKTAAPDLAAEAAPSEAEDDTQSGPSAHSEYIEANGEAEPDQPAEGGVAEAEADLDTLGSESSLDTVETPVDDLSIEEADTLVTEPTDEPTPAAEASLDQADTTVIESDPESDPTVFIESDDTVVMDQSVLDQTVIQPGADPIVGGEEPRSNAGTYRGTEPPEGFTIKGNDRSMKYHLAGSDGYVRTIAEVWFESEEAAQAAGYTSAQ